MAFWDLSDGGAATDNDSKEFDGGGGNFDPIPDGSSVLAIAEAAEWQIRKPTSPARSM